METSECKSFDSRKIRPAGDSNPSLSLYGFIIRSNGAEPDRLSISLFAKLKGDHPEWCIFRALNRDRMPVFDSREASTVFFQKLSWETNTGLSSCKATNRLNAAFENCISMHAFIDVPMPVLPTDTRYIELELATGCQLVLDSKRGPSSTYVERRRCDLGFGIKRDKTCYGFFVNDQILKNRIDEIERILMDPPTKFSEDVRSETLVKSLFSLLGGYDTPLLWKE
jgi:hypothetical protein